MTPMASSVQAGAAAMRLDLDPSVVKDTTQWIRRLVPSAASRAALAKDSRIE